MATIDLNGTEIWFNDSGGDGEVVLFHHGYTGSHDAWPQIIQRLDPARRYILMDGRGAGDSGRPDNDSYSLEQYVADVIGLVDALGIDTLSFVGHSMGGAMGFLLGLDHASRLSKLVLVAPIPSGGIEATSSMRTASAALWYAGDEDEMVRQRVVGSARPDNVDELRVKGSVVRALSVSQGYYEQSWDSMARLDVTDRLSELTTPTLVVAGAADGLVRANVEDYLRLPNAGLHVFNSAGHSIPTDVPEAFAATLDDFFDEGVVTARTLIKRAARSVVE